MELQPPDHSNPQPDENYIVGSPSSAMLRVLDTDRIPAPPFLNTPPAVTFLRPTNGAQFTVPAVITLEAEAADADFGITAVEFLAGNTVIGVVTNKFLFESGPTIFRFIWTNIPPGEYGLQTRATDTFGRATMSPRVLVTVLPTNVAPLVTITASDRYAGEDRGSGSDVGQILMTRIGGPDRPLQVFYTADGTAVAGLDYVQLPGSVTIPAGTNSVAVEIQPLVDHLPEGSEYVFLTLQSISTYRLDPSAAAGVLILDEDLSARSTPPIIRLTSPPADATFPRFSDIPLSVDILSAPRPLVSVTYRANGRVVGVATNASFSLIWSNAFPDIYAVSAEASDVWGISDETPAVAIQVGEADSNQAPFAEITSPADGAIYNARSFLTIAAWLRDPDSLSGAAELFINNVLVNTFTNVDLGPEGDRVSFPWQGIPPGNYAIKIRVTDNWGASSTSPEVNVAIVQRPIIVQPPQSRSVSNSATVMFSVHGYGFPQVNYQWLVNDLVLPGATDSTLTVSNVSVCDSGSRISVLVSNAVGQAKTHFATLTVLAFISPSEGAAITLANTNSLTPLQLVNGSLAVPYTFTEVWAGPAGQPLLHRLANETGETRFGLARSGFFNGGIGIIPALSPGNSAQFLIRSWRGGLEFARSPLRGMSPLFTQTTGVWDPPGMPSPAPLQIPEPIILRPAGLPDSTPWQNSPADVILGGCPLQISAFTVLPDGSSQLTISSEPGVRVDLELSTDLVTWISLTVITNTYGSLGIIDLGSRARSQSFYRVR